jgi:hypothetical protein
VKLIISPRDAIIKASLIIKNIHPYELNSSLNSFILKKLDKYELLGLTSLEITAVEKKQFIEKFENILNLLTYFMVLSNKQKILFFKNY